MSTCTCNLATTKTQELVPESTRWLSFWTTLLPGTTADLGNSTTQFMSNEHRKSSNDPFMCSVVYEISKMFQIWSIPCGDPQGSASTKQSIILSPLQFGVVCSSHKGKLPEAFIVHHLPTNMNPLDIAQRHTRSEHVVKTSSLDGALSTPFCC